MESLSIYEESEKELQKLKKDLHTKDIVTINFKNLDSNTQGKIKKVLHEAIAERIGTIGTITRAANV